MDAFGHRQLNKSRPLKPQQIPTRLDGTWRLQPNEWKKVKFEWPRLKLAT
jgi:hypothetical protein